MLETAIDYIGTRFTPADYVLWSRIEGTAWTLADIIICFYLIRIANVARRILHKRRHIVPYVALVLTVPLAALIPLAQNGTAFLFLEILVTVPHFLIITYILCTNASLCPQVIGRLIVRTSLDNCIDD